jgi:hypothetical protein
MIKRLFPIYNPVSNLMYSAPGTTASTVTVARTVVMEEGKISTVDDQAVYRTTLGHQPHILEATGLKDSIAPKWRVF